MCILVRNSRRICNAHRVYSSAQVPSHMFTDGMAVARHMDSDGLYAREINYEERSKSKTRRKITEHASREFVREEIPTSPAQRLPNGQHARRATVDARSPLVKRPAPARARRKLEAV